MPQGERSPTDAVAFKRMLPRINMLYLGCSVLLIVDNTYVGRFWTQFEAWLAMRSCTPDGLRSTAPDAVRFVMKCIHLAKDKFQGEQLREMWVDASADKAFEVLSSPDVTVTNQSDKDVQLPKVQKLDDEVRGVFRNMQGAIDAKRAEAQKKRAEATKLDEEAEKKRAEAKELDEAADRMQAFL